MRHLSSVHQVEGGSGVMVMPANNSCAKKLAEQYPSRIGWLLGPSSWNTPPPHLSYALDNDAFGAFKNGTEWDENAWLAMLEQASKVDHPPLWAIVPDVVGDREATIRSYHKYEHVVASYGFTKAFAVQDGMTPSDVPKTASVVFVGGTTSWKWRNLTTWTDNFPRVHVGRVRMTKLMRCLQLGVESCDGTGWFRESQNGKPARFLKAYLSGELQQHPELFREDEYSRVAV